MSRVRCGDRTTPDVHRTWSRSPRDMNAHVYRRLFLLKETGRRGAGGGHQGARRGGVIKARQVVSSAERRAAACEHGGATSALRGVGHRTSGVRPRVVDAAGEISRSPPRRVGQGPRPASGARTETIGPPAPLHPRRTRTRRDRADRVVASCGRSHSSLLDGRVRGETGDRGRHARDSEELCWRRIPGGPRSRWLGVRWPRDASMPAAD